MFTCISQLWDWLEPQPFETTTMDGRKNYNVPHDARRYSQLVPGQPQDLYMSDAYQQQLQHQQQQLYNLMYESDYAQDYISSGYRGPTTSIDQNLLSPSEITPTETQPYGNHHNIYYDRMLQEQLQQQRHHEQLEHERLYQMNTGRVNQNTATSRLKHQYQQLQEEKMRLQIQTQNDAFLQQQQTFALRQQLNPPVPSSYPQSPTSMTSQISLSQQHQPKIPPQNLNLTNQYVYSPEGKNEKIDYQGAMNFQVAKDQEHLVYKQNLLIQQQKQTSQQLQNLSLQSPQGHQVIIQQNHPSKVVNQAVQTQMSDASQKSSSSTSNTPQSPSHSILERRKSESLKSPIIKRMEGAPITLSGFLNKQGSDGLKVWKKRYFILSEYCLFYYKGPEQEKLLGSVLLPSYTISACTPDDKVYRKYAFKCEHANMRTYVLAADTQESMEQWMKYLTMAAAMQDSSDSGSGNNQSCTNFEIQTYQSKKGQYGPITRTNEKQPLYINAPPKPSRRGDLGYISPISADNHMHEIYDAPRSTQNFVNTQAIYGIRSDTVTTNIINKKDLNTKHNQPRHIISKQLSPSYPMQDHNIMERRTPDEYAPQEYTINKRNYEDIYGINTFKNNDDQQPSYRRPTSPQNQIVPNQNVELPQTRVPMRDKGQAVPRPHSADFLDYENRVQLMPYEQNRAPRPKSSLDINRALDHYYYSEASYAEQMRTESANYLPKQSYRANSSYSQTQPTQQHESRAQKITKRALRQQEFLRSASARIPRKVETPLNADESDKKREESMKRLLEWKQRMLQSPLTRKIASQTSTLPLENRHFVSNDSLKSNIHRAKSDIIKKDESYNSYSSDDEASISVKNVNFIPKGNLTVKTDPRQTQAKDKNRNIAENQTQSNYSDYQINSTTNKLKAGELLNRTHEELVLLLIQLRKENTLVVRHIEKCCTKIHEVQNKIRLSDGVEKQQNFSKLDNLKQQLCDLEKKYEESKPLVNLVDNMVKLGSLYNKNSENDANSTMMLEQNQREQERRMFADEKKQWDRISPNPVELQNKVQQLDDLDQLLHEESNTLQSLQKDKQGIEKAISGLQSQLQNNNTSNGALEAARKQQQILEQELSNVHKLLAENSKKLESTVNSNRKLEQELLVLRQKLQSSRDTKDSKPNSEGVSSYGSGATLILESELRRVQVLVADMQRQRQDLSLAVRQLTDNSNSLYHQLRKRSDTKCPWSETDLDLENIEKDKAASFEISSKNNREMLNDLDQNLSNLAMQDKQEIKTVRIVKREAEKRQRDREKTDKSINNLDEVLKEEFNVLQEYNQSRLRSQSRDADSYNTTNPFRTGKSWASDRSLESFGNDDNSYLVTFTHNEQPASESSTKGQKSDVESSLIYRSEAAKQIITEMSNTVTHDSSANSQKRLVPKEKKRHNTAPHHINSQFIELMQSNNEPDKNILNSRALDDIDMEVALRPRLNAPDVVKSAIGQREKFSENTIDKLFATPDKILIPERYIPENEELELSPDEQRKRKAKVESIKKMLSETPSMMDSQALPHSQIVEEKRQREHLLQLNQIIAKQVMQMSKIVAERAMTFCPSKIVELQNEALSDDDDSPTTPLPIYQIRDNFYT